MNIFLILSLLALQLTKKKSLCWNVFMEYKLKIVKLKTSQLKKKKKEKEKEKNKFIICIYCMKDEIFINQEKR